MNPLVLSHVKKTFPGKTGPIVALRDADFAIEEGEIFGLLGPNGAGKTTIINIALNLLKPDSGEVRIFGEKPGPNVLRQINLIAGGSSFHWAQTPKDILTFFSKAYHIPERDKKIAEVLQKTRTEHLQDRKFSWLSTGERLRVAFAKALLNSPKLLLMDEPTLGLDPDVARQIRKEILNLKKSGTTILLTTHYMHEVEQLCDRIGFIYRGQIIDVGRVKEVKLKHFGTYDVILTLNKKPSTRLAKDLHLTVKENKAKATLEREDALANLLAAVHTAGYKIIDIHLKKPSLEDYFIKITGEQQ